MIKNALTAAALGLGIAAITTATGAEQAGALAQEADPAATPTIVAQPVLTQEVMPAFVSNEVVQTLPEEGPATEDFSDVAAAASSLRELVAITPTDGQLSEEMHCLAGAVYFESRGEPLAGQLAVAQVVINRAESSRFPESYCGVVYQRSQFSFVRGGSMPSIRKDSQAWQRAKAIARIAHRGLWESPAADALYFHASYVRPAWSRKKTRRAAISTHIFYR